MRKSGITLVEVTIAMVLGAILVIIFTNTVVVGLSLVESYKTRYAIVNEAVVAMNQMARTMRFADPANNPSTDEFIPDGNKFIVKGGYLPEFPVDTRISYRCVNHSFIMDTYDSDGVTVKTSHVLATGIVAWNCILQNKREGDWGYPDIWIVKVEYGNIGADGLYTGAPREFGIETKIKLALS